MKHSDRILELDLLKTFILVVSMVGIHCMYELTDLNVNDGILEYVLNILATPFCAPMFMFCMGLTFGYSLRKEISYYFRRGIRLITFGMVLNVLRYLPTAYSATKAGEADIFRSWAQIFNVDILQFAGLALMLIAVLSYLKLSHRFIFVLGFVLNIIGTLLDGCSTDSYVVNQLLGCFFPTKTCCCFPLMNWFVFVAAGNSVGSVYRNRTAEKFLRLAFPTGAVITAVYLYLCLAIEAPFTRVFQNDWGYYSMHTPDAIFIVFGIAPFMLGLFRLFTMALPRKRDGVLIFPSRHINQFYCISWVLIMWVANLFLFVPKATTDAGFLLIWLSVVILSAIAVIIYDRYLKSTLNSFFDRHSAAWIIAVWVTLIIFGVWYFSSVPGPYTMPY